MRNPFVMLLGAEDLTAVNRWRLVDGLYLPWRPMVEGTLALIAVTGLCALRTGWWGFGAEAALTLALLGMRLAQRAAFLRLNGNGGPTRRFTPDYWARRHSAGVLAVAAMWGAVTLSAAWRGGDPVLLLMVIAVEAGWLGAACIRSAASPFATIGQALLTLGPTIAADLASQNHLLRLMAPFSCVQFTATMAIARYMSAQTAARMVVEQRLETANARLTELSATDWLTGIPNRRAFDSALQTEWARAAREGSTLGLLIIDVDHFKAFNDRYGHPAGDECLRLVAAISARAVRRPLDMAARFGGEEFALLLPNTPAHGAADVAERLRLAIMAASLTHEGSDCRRVTVSIGAATAAPRPGSACQRLIELADCALYDAKRRGRNMVRFAPLGVAPPAGSPDGDPPAAAPGSGTG